MLNHTARLTLACELSSYITAAATIIASVAAAVVLVLRELRWKHPTDQQPPPNTDPGGTPTA